MKKHSYPMANIGSVPLLMTFILLCLVVFAVLALSGAVKEYQYSRKVAEYTHAYYEASNSATETLREIDELLHTAHLNSFDGNSSEVATSGNLSSDRYYRAAEEQLSQLHDVEVDFTQEEPTVAYEVPINDSRKLQVVLTLNPVEEIVDPYGADSRQAHDQAEQPSATGYYRITAWQNLPSAPWKADDRMNLFHPDR